MDMEKNGWMDKVTNEDVLRKVNENNIECYVAMEMETPLEWSRFEK